MIRAVMVLGCLVFAFALAVSSVNADLITYTQTWNDTDGGSDPVVVNGQNIVSYAYGNDAGHHYFKMVLQAAPGTATGDWAGLYGVYIDADANGQTGSSGVGFSYIPDQMTGIEFIKDSHAEAGLGTFNYTDFHDHAYTGTWSTDPSAAGDHAENGAVLEWRIEKKLIRPEFCFRLATSDAGSSVDFYDITDAVCVPEPISISLLAVGGLALLRRR